VKKINKVDVDIINLLMENGRMTASEIAQRIGFTERSVRYRIGRLIERDIIKVTAVINPRALGYNVIADVWIEVESGSNREVAQKLLAHDFISYVATSIGERDISAQVVGRTNEEIYDIVTEIIGQIKGVRKTKTSIVPIVLRDIYEWRVPGEMLMQQKDEDQ
jgi:Lrp/AsnC family transcriptional regulator for asnA, asnC and gidA